MTTSADNYYSEIEGIEKSLSSAAHDQDNLYSLQARIDELMRLYRNDESLDTDRYGLYQVQAMLSYRQGEFDKAKKFIDYSVVVREKCALAC